MISEFPGRVAAVYIHDVRESRREDVSEIAQQIRDGGVDMMLVESALAAARHAADKGLIREDALEQIAACT